MAVDHPCRAPGHPSFAAAMAALASDDAGHVGNQESCVLAAGATSAEAGTPLAQIDRVHIKGTFCCGRPLLVGRTPQRACRSRDHAGGYAGDRPARATIRSANRGLYGPGASTQEARSQAARIGAARWVFRQGHAPGGWASASGARPAPGSGMGFRELLDLDRDRKSVV